MKLPFLFLTCALSSISLAQDRIGPDRPDVTNSPDVVGKGKVQLEVGFAYNRVDDSKVNSALSNSVVRYGLCKTFEVRFGLPAYQWGPDAVNFGQPGLGAKLHLANKGRLSIGFETDTNLPVWGDDRRWFPDAFIALDEDLGHDYDLSSNIGVSYASDGNGRFAQGYGTLNLGHPLSPKADGILEWFFPHGLRSGDKFQNFVNVGSIYYLNNDEAIDGLVGFGANGRSELTLTAGFSKRW